MSISHPDWWDGHSDQPFRIPQAQRAAFDRARVWEHALTAATALAFVPAVAWRYLALKPRPAEVPVTRFAGLGVSPDPGFWREQSELVAELGVEELALRVPSWHAGAADRYQDFASRFPGRRFLIVIPQSRDSVMNPSGWAEALRRIFDAFSGLTGWFQVGNAVNRVKWGCAHTGEYLRLLEIAEEVRRDYPRLKLLGSSVIDFEPLVTLRTLRNRRRFRLDAVSALLYVNRRGSPYNRQFGLFDLERKLRLIRAIVGAGSRNADRLWITETNWPLLNTKPWTPNSGHPRSTVDEPTQAEYLKHYYRIARRTGYAEKVYWWQLIAPGYGLVDHRGGRLRKHPSYDAMRELLADEALS
jgi:hypothetical protein